jgi:hypothetical protein
MPRSNLITLPWARAAMKIYADKCYVKKEWTTEQLYDLAFSVLKQRPQLRKDVVECFRKFNDPSMISFILFHYPNPSF